MEFIPKDQSSSTFDISKLTQEENNMIKLKLREYDDFNFKKY